MNSERIFCYSCDKNIAGNDTEQMSGEEIYR
jgi:hypothetical protein